MFRLDAFNGLGIDGGESTFLVHKDLRFLKATSCEDLKIGLRASNRNFPADLKVVSNTTETQAYE